MSPTLQETTLSTPVLYVNAGGPPATTRVRLRCRLTTPRSALNRPSLYRMQSHSGEEKGVDHGAAA